MPAQWSDTPPGPPPGLPAPSRRQDGRRRSAPPARTGPHRHASGRCPEWPGPTALRPKVWCPVGPSGARESQRPPGTRPSAASRARTLQSFGLLSDLFDQSLDPQVLRLEAGTIDDEPRGRGGDLLNLHQPVFLQGLAGRHQVNDPFRQPNQGSQLDGTGQLDDLRLYPLPAEEPLGEVGILGGDPQVRPRVGVVSLAQFGRLSHHQPTGAKAKVEGLVDIALLLEQLVLSHDPHVGGPMFDVGRDVRGPERQKPEAPILVLADKAARIRELSYADDPHPLEQLKAVVEQPPLWERDRNQLVS